MLLKIFNNIFINIFIKCLKKNSSRVMHALLGSFNSGNWSNSDDLDRTGLSCRTIMRNRGAII